MELTVHLRTIEELFQAPELDMFSSSPRLVSGMEEVLQEFVSRGLSRHLRVVLVLPPDRLGAIGQEQLESAVRRYCDLRLRQVEAVLRAQLRDGLRSLWTGGILFLIGIFLSYAFSRPEVPEDLQLLLGSGAFLVLAWVGLWYPLDSLAFYRRPMLRERRALRAMRGMELVLRGEPCPRPAIE